MRWARLALVTFAAACGAVPGGTETRAPETAAPRDARDAATPPRVVARRRTTAPSEQPPAIEDVTDATPDAPAPDAETGTLVRGRVEDEGGAPLPQAHVVAFLGICHDETTTDADGRFSIAVGEPTGAVRCLAWADDHAVVVGPWFALREGEHADAGTLRCGRAARIDGRLVGVDGRNERGSVSVESSSAFDDETMALLRRCAGLDGVRVDSCGCGTCDKLSIRFLPAGRYVLRVGDDGETVTIDAPADDVLLHTPPRGPWAFDVEVRVLEWDGSPAAGCVPRAVPRYDSHRVTQSCRIDGDSATLRLLCEDAPYVTVVAGMPDGRCATQEVTAGATERVELTLPRYAPSERRSIRGTVTFGGRPVRFGPDAAGDVKGTSVYVTASATGHGYGKGAETAADGTFDIDGLDPGEYTLRARTYDVWGDAPALAMALVIADAGSDDVVIEMPASQSRRFRVLLPSGFGPVDDYDVEVEGPEGYEDWADAELTGDELVVTGMRENVPYSLTVRVRCGATWTQTARVASFTAGSETLSVLLDAGLRITGRVVRADGTPVVAAYVWVGSDDSDAWDTCTDLDGRFAVVGVEPGRWRLEASAPGLSAGDGGIAVDAGTENLRVRLDTER